jgi:tetratricopeptide (TPR) repeat protein
MYILGWSNAPALQYRPHLDEFQLRLDSTVRAAINGDPMAAFRDCGDLIRAAGSIAQRIEAVCLDASTSLRFGNLKRAQHRLRDASQLAKNAPPDAESSLWILALARIDSVAAELAHRTSQSAKAVKFAESARDKLRPILENASPAAGTAYVQFLSLRAAGLWNLGDVDRAYEAFTEVEARLSAADRAGWLGAQVMVPVWRARNRLVMSAKSWRPVWQRIEGLRDVFQNAYRLGALHPAADALEGLTEVYAFSGNEAEALATGRLAVAIAEHQGSEWIRARTMLSVAQRLLRTPSTSYALSLIASVEALAVDAADAVAHSRLSSLVAERALRLQQYGTAWRLATAPGPRAEPTEIVLRKNVIAAVALHQLGRRSEALRQIESLVPLAERLAIAPVLFDAYRIASRVTLNTAFARKAAEIQDLLRA